MLSEESLKSYVGILSGGSWYSSRTENSVYRRYKV